MMTKSESVLAVSSRSWLSYIHQSRLHLTPLSYEVLDYVSSFSSEQCPEGIVAIATNTLRILSLEKLGIIFNQVATPLQVREPSCKLCHILGPHLFHTGGGGRAYPPKRFSNKHNNCVSIKGGQNYSLM